MYHGSSCCVSNGGKNSPGEKINSEYYCEHVLKRGLLPVIQATRHVVAITELYSKTKFLLTQPEIQSTFFIRRTLTSSKKWPPNSTRLNPVNYAIWVALKEKIYIRRKFTTVERLKLKIIKKWRNPSQRFIDRSTNEWRQCLEKVVEKQGDTLNRFSDYLNTWQTAVYDRTIILI